MKIKHSLYAKLIIAYGVFAALCIAVLVLFASPLTLNFLTKNRAAELYKEATLISNNYADNFYNDALSSDIVMDQLKAIDSYTSESVWIISSNGEVLFNSDIDQHRYNHQILEAFDPSIVGSSYYVTGNFFDQYNNEMLSVIAPITYNYTIKGYVVVHTTIASIVESRDAIMLILIFTVGFIFILSLLILVVFTRIVYNPLKKITEATEAFAEGNFKYDINITSNDEIGYLAASLKYMAGELSNFEDNQKKFIANVSHDFRSPLTSIKGYLEAMSDGTIPPEMYDKYINIVLNETDRLTKLTNSMLTLNNLNIKGMNLDLSDFDINKIIKNTVATFEGSCTKKRIRISLVLTGKSLYVNADMGKIQQVLYNLIDNAIKFSPHDSTIKVETTQKNEKIFVSVKDSGIGIPKESLKQIFDRFYKTDISRGKDKKGTGLGLAITKEIINAHHENINVISTVDVGTEFIFTLPKSKTVDEEDEE